MSVFLFYGLPVHSTFYEENIIPYLGRSARQCSDISIRVDFPSPTAIGGAIRRCEGFKFEHVIGGGKELSKIK